MYILDICSNGDVLRVVRIIRIVLTVIRIAVPIMLIVSLMINYLNAVKDNDSDALNKANKNAVPKIIAAILVFLIPTFVNIIASAVDYNKELYISCLKFATKENIDRAYVTMAEQYVELAKTTLNESDYLMAIKAINKITDENTKNELLKELEDVKLYFDILNEMQALKEKFDRELLEKIKKRIEEVKDTFIKEKLLKALEEIVGKNGTLEMFDINPSSKLYKNTKPLKNITIKQLLEKNGSSVEKLNLEMKNNVLMFGAGTREAPVAAAMTLHETLARYGYHLYYRWGGKHNSIGVNSSWGAFIGSTSLCTSVPHPNPEYCLDNFKYSGLDCSGFVNWALAQGFQSTRAASQATSNKGTISLRGKKEAVCNVGDVLVNEVHITMVAKLDDSNKRYIILEDTGSHGMRLSTIPYNTSAYNCRKIKYSN